MQVNLIDSHMRIVIIADALTLLLALCSYFLPPLQPLRAQLWGIFEGFNGALLMSLRVGGPTETPNAPAPPASQG